MRDYARKHRQHYVTRAERRAKARFGEKVVLLLITLAVSAVFAMTLLEVAVGCGEPIYKADGTYITGECLFVPYTPVEGTWR